MTRAEAMYSESSYTSRLEWSVLQVSAEGRTRFELAIQNSDSGLIQRHRGPPCVIVEKIPQAKETWDGNQNMS